MTDASFNEKKLKEKNTEDMTSVSLMVATALHTHTHTHTLLNTQIQNYTHFGPMAKSDKL